jgi:hypothetical protein
MIAMAMEGLITKNSLILFLAKVNPKGKEIAAGILDLLCITEE